MQIRNIKKATRNLITYMLVCLVLLTACTAPAAVPRFDPETIGWVHVDDISDTYTYAGDFSTEQAQLEGCVASDGNWSAIQEYLDELTDPSLQVDAAKALQDIHSIKNVNDVNAQQAVQELEALSNKMYDHLKNIIMLVAESRYEDQFSKRYGDGIAAYIEQEMANELVIPAENSIIQQRQIAFVSDYHFMYKGVDWTFEKLWNDGLLSNQDYWAINDGLCTQKNKAMGDLLMSLIEKRIKAAHNAGIDYPTNAHQSYNFRDYSLDEVLALCEAVKKSTLPALLAKVSNTYEEVYHNAYELSDSVYNQKDMSDIDFFQEISRVVGKRSEAIGKIAEGLRENRLYFYEKYAEGSYQPMTVSLTAYGLGLIYLPKDIPMSDLQTLIHEFGHFCSCIIEAPKDPVEKLRLIVQGNTIPTELDSYGMEMLLMQDYSDLFGEDAPAVHLVQLTYILHDIVSSALYSEFEISLYRDPPKSVEEANARFSELEKAYGNTVNRPDIPDGMQWAEVPHYFSSPLYYPNYLTAIMPIVGSMLGSEETVEKQYEKYINLLQIGPSLSYRKLLEKVDMPDPFNPGVIKTISDDMERFSDETLFNFNTYIQQLEGAAS